jgi:hypothetical protein
MVSDSIVQGFGFLGLREGKGMKVEGCDEQEFGAKGWQRREKLLDKQKG